MQVPLYTPLTATLLNTKPLSPDSGNEMVFSVWPAGYTRHAGAVLSIEAVEKSATVEGGTESTTNVGQSRVFRVSGIGFIVLGSYV